MPITAGRLIMDPKIWILKIPLLLFFENFISHCYSSSTGASTINPNQSIADGNVLLSPGGIFALGFFRPGNSDRRYVGIWFNKAPGQTVVWVANRNNPIRDTSGILSFDDTQNLALYGINKTPIWSTNIPSPRTSGAPNYFVMAKLLDTGNFVLLHQETQKVIWQSFDHPTDSVLPFMKLKWDRRTGVNRTLTSWKSKDDPGTGSCSCGFDPTGVPQFILNMGPSRWWRGGPWNGLRFSGMPDQRSHMLFQANVVETPDMVSGTYSLGVDSSMVGRFTVYETGSVQLLTWKPGDEEWFTVWSAPKDLCDSYGQCGKYSYCDPNFFMSDFECKCLPGFRPRSVQDWGRGDGKSGCVWERGQRSTCGNGAGFVRLEHVKVPDTRVARKNMSLSGRGCQEECFRNCTCMAYASATVGADGSESGCITWYGDLLDIKLYPKEGQDLYIRVDAIELENSRKRARGSHGAKKKIVIVVGSVVLVALLWTLLCCGLSKLRDRAKRRRQNKLLLLNLASRTHNNNVEENECEEGHKKTNLPFFNMREMKYATANFSNKLGQGGFGIVYKGHLSNGQEIAVKRLSKHSGQGAEEFKNEVLLIARLQHRNLVKILGCCIDEEETILIYEYMPNKSLDSFIFDDCKKALLDWKRRYKIIIGIARGILYLHQDSRLRIVHRDLKTSNILLDGEMIPKISDFGMARIFEGNQSQANTNRVVGTFGYMSPEYALDGLFSVKSDVFSFGVILLEIISGKKNNSFYNKNPFSNLIRYIWDLWREGRALEIVDPSMGDSWQEVEVLRCVQVGLLCVQENATDRPTMFTIVSMLSNEVNLPSPKKPPFAIQTREDSAPSSTAPGSISSSSNNVTMSLLEPR